jgi:hypothetical protein
MASVNLNAVPPPQIAGAIRQAAKTTGTSFDYLLATAQLESRLNPAAEAPTSSAGGLYQFIDQTWLAMVKNAGPSLGLSAYAQAVVQLPDGRYDVPDPGARAAILKLRNDPAASAMMAGAFTRNNRTQLAQAIGRPPNDGELYLAHFLGADGAGRLINTVNTQPRSDAAAMFPAAAAANRSIFYTADGRSRTVADVYGRLTARFESARAAAVAGDLRGPVSPSATPDTAGFTQALATAQAPRSLVLDTRPLFQAMFTDRGASALAPAVTSLWTTTAAAPAPPTVTPAGPAGHGTLDLFTDSKPNLRGMFGAS